MACLVRFWAGLGDLARGYRLHSNADGSGSISPSTPTPCAIAATEAKIEAVEAALSGRPTYLGISDRGVFLDEKKQLQDKEKQLLFLLLDEKKQLREIELLLLKKPAAAAVSLSGACTCCRRFQIVTTLRSNKRGVSGRSSTWRCV